MHQGSACTPLRPKSKDLNGNYLFPPKKRTFSPKMRSLKKENFPFFKEKEYKEQYGSPEAILS
jgi:hypothetical protein